MYRNHLNLFYSLLKDLRGFQETKERKERVFLRKRHDLTDLNLLPIILVRVPVSTVTRHNGDFGYRRVWSCRDPEGVPGTVADGPTVTTNKFLVPVRAVGHT